MSEQKTVHQPVMVDEVLRLLDPKSGESYLDVTAGYGGHAEAVLGHSGAYSDTVLVDRDEQAIGSLKRQFGPAGAEILHDDFLAASKILLDAGKHFDMIFADLGVSSVQFDEAGRGFSFSNPGPLDMRMDRRQSLSAHDIVNRYTKDELTEIFVKFGEEPKARQIAARIVANRPIDSTDQLAKLAKSVWPSRSRVHPATRIFQALRIAVNGELQQLQNSLPIWIELLEQGGRLAVISFHSLEDRIVKQYFAEHSSDYFDGYLKILTKKPIAASRREIDSNPRARSAKLRAAAKIKTKIERNKDNSYAY